MYCTYSLQRLTRFGYPPLYSRCLSFAGINLRRAPASIFGVMYGPIFLTMLLSIGTLLWVWRVGSLRLCPKGWARTRQRLMLWVLVFTLLWVFPMAKRAYDLVHRKNPDGQNPEGSVFLDVMHKVRLIKTCTQIDMHATSVC